MGARDGSESSHQELLRDHDPLHLAGALPDFADLRVAQMALDEGLVVRAMGDSIAFCPPLIITEEQVDELFDRFERALGRFANELA